MKLSARQSSRQLLHPQIQDLTQKANQSSGIVQGQKALEENSLSNTKQVSPFGSAKVDIIGNQNAEIAALPAELDSSPAGSDDSKDTIQRNAAKLMERRLKLRKQQSFQID